MINEYWGYRAKEDLSINKDILLELLYVSREVYKVEPPRRQIMLDRRYKCLRELGFFVGYHHYLSSIINALTLPSGAQFTDDDVINLLEYLGYNIIDGNNNKGD